MQALISLCLFVVTAFTVCIFAPMRLPVCEPRGEKCFYGCTEVKINIGILEENKVLRRWYQSFGFVHTGTQKFVFFPFICGYMEKNLK